MKNLHCEDLFAYHGIICYYNVVTGVNYKFVYKQESYTLIPAFFYAFLSHFFEESAEISAASLLIFIETIINAL